MTEPTIDPPLGGTNQCVYLFINSIECNRIRMSSTTAGSDCEAMFNSVFTHTCAYLEPTLT